MKKTKHLMGSLGGLILVVSSVGVLLAPWIYHLVYCFQNEKYLLLIAGAIVAPVGWFHGFGAFFGWW